MVGALGVRILVVHRFDTIEAWSVHGFLKGGSKGRSAGAGLADSLFKGYLLGVYVHGPGLGQAWPGMAREFFCSLVLHEEATRVVVISEQLKGMARHGPAWPGLANHGLAWPGWPGMFGLAMATLLAMTSSFGLPR